MSVNYFEIVFVCAVDDYLIIIVSIMHKEPPMPDFPSFNTVHLNLSSTHDQNQSAIEQVAAATAAHAASATSGSEPPGAANEGVSTLARK